MFEELGSHQQFYYWKAFLTFFAKKHSLDWGFQFLTQRVIELSKMIWVRSPANHG